MLTFYKFTNNNLNKINSFQKDCLINLHNPTQNEITQVSTLLNINESIITRMLDLEERSRIDIRENYLLSVINIALKNKNNSLDVSPIGMMVFSDSFLLVSNDSLNPITYIEKIDNIDDLIKNKINFFISICYETSKSYVKHTRNIIKEFEELESKLIKDTDNETVLKVLDIRKTLTFFTMSLYSNDLVIARLMKLNDKKYQNTSIDFSNLDEELLDDVYSENKQAMEMVDTYSKIVIDLMDTIASIVANEQNRFLKLLANITILLTIPMVFAGFWGMNVKVPFEGQIIGFWLVLSLSVSLIGLSIFYLWKKKSLK